MGNPYSSQSASGYNSNPPPDDGSQTSTNRLYWATIKTKITDPVKALADAINTAISNAFGKTFGSAGISSTNIALALDGTFQGRLVRVTTAGITITTPDATSVTSPFCFAVLNNSSGSITIDGNGTQKVDGADTASIPAGAGVIVHTDGSDWFTCGQTTGTQITPQGRLTLTSGVPVLATGVSAATSVYYTPNPGNLVPIYNGSLFAMRQFAELTLTLQNNSNYAANSIYDVFAFDNSGVVTIGVGPAWANSTSGSSARGSGAGTTELQLLGGINTNKNQITAHNGGTSYTVTANSGTYLGSILIDGTNGQVSCLFAYGQSRKWGVWNAYNRRSVVMNAGDATATWSYATNTIRAANNAAANSITTLCGLPEEPYSFDYWQNLTTANNNSAFTIGIGFDVTNAFSGSLGVFPSITTGTVSNYATLHAIYEAPPSLGVHTITALERADSGVAVTLNGTEAYMRLRARYMA